jgi:hypothetical protein
MLPDRLAVRAKSQRNRTTDFVARFCHEGMGFDMALGASRGGSAPAMHMPARARTGMGDDTPWF